MELAADEWGTLVDEAIACVEAAGARALEIVRSGALDVEAKADRSLVTAADKAAEALARAELARRFGDDPFVGEESVATQPAGFARRALEAPRCWVLDPIDGTYNVTAGSPRWCVALALLAHGAPVLGVIYQPVSGRLVFNRGDVLLERVDGEERPLPEATPNAELLSYEGMERRFRLAAAYRKRSTGSMVLNMLDTVAGPAVGTFTSARIWDVAAPLALAARRGMPFVSYRERAPLEAFSLANVMSEEDPLRAWRLRDHHLLARPHDVTPLLEALARR